jgi:transposase
MYSVIEKGIIKSKIVPYLPLAKRGFQATVPLEEIVNAVLYKLKTGVQWYQLPVKSLFDDDLLMWQSVYYRKWCRTDVLKKSWICI